MDRRKYDNLNPNQKMDRVLERLDDFEEAFPFGIEHHKEMHKQIEQAKIDEKIFLKDLKTTLLKNGILAILVFILSMVLLGTAVRWSAFVKGL